MDLFGDTPRNIEIRGVVTGIVTRRWIDESGQVDPKVGGGRAQFSVQALPRRQTGRQVNALRRSVLTNGGWQRVSLPGYVA